MTKTKADYQKLAEQCMEVLANLRNEIRISVLVDNRVKQGFIDMIDDVLGVEEQIDDDHDEGEGEGEQSTLG